MLPSPGCVLRGAIVIQPNLDGWSAIRKLGRSLVRYRDPQRYLNKVEIWSWVSMEDGRAPTTVL